MTDHIHGSGRDFPITGCKGKILVEHLRNTGGCWESYDDILQHESFTRIFFSCCVYPGLILKRCETRSRDPVHWIPEALIHRIKAPKDRKSARIMLTIGLKALVGKRRC
jgi:hypothetical protein